MPPSGHRGWGLGGRRWNIAQRLEGVAGAYGFAGVAEAAAELAAASLDQVRNRVARVVELCRRAATARVPV